MKVNDFDNMIKTKANSESILLPREFEERNDKLINELINSSNTPEGTTRLCGLRYKTVAFILIVCLLLGGVTVAAHGLTGGGFFTRFFEDKANKDVKTDYSYMNTEQLGDMASSTVGTVIDTEELTVDVLGLIVSGNTANLMMEVTANELDSVLYDNGFETLKNYRFNGESTNQNNNIEFTSIRYFYNDEDKSLAPNQFKILFTFIASESFGEELYTMEFDKFGYFSSSADKSVTDFVTIYDESWKFDFCFLIDSNIDSRKMLFVNKPITIDDVDLIIESINITPLASTIRLKCNLYEGYSDEYYHNIYKKFSGGIDKITFRLADGFILDSVNFKSSGSGEMDTLEANLIFKVPITVEDVVSITLYGGEYSTEVY